MSKKLIDRIGADKIIEVCNSSNTFKEACEKLDCGYRYLVVAAIELNVFDGLNERSKKYSRKHSFDQKDRPWIIKTVNKCGVTSYKTDHKIWCEELFKGNVNSSAVRIKKHLLLAGLKEDKCEQCGISEWNNLPISLQLHHIDGNTNNNKLDNLMILCPNCHTQTDNYGSKNASKKECQVVS